MEPACLHQQALESGTSAVPTESKVSQAQEMSCMQKDLQQQFLPTVIDLCFIHSGECVAECWLQT